MKQENPIRCYPHACSKGELAQRYLPHVTQAAARRTVRLWIERNPKFKAALEAVGYTDRSVILTPMQVQIYYDFLAQL